MRSARDVVNKQIIRKEQDNLMLRENNQSNLKTPCNVTVPARYKGPPDIASGGSVCSLLAKYIDGVIDVMIKRPSPLDRELQIRAGDGGMYSLMDVDFIDDF